MGVSHSPRELAAKFEGLGADLKDHERSALTKAAMTAKVALLAAPGAPRGTLKGVGARGARVGVKYTIFGNTAAVRWFGPAHLVNYPTKAHKIAPKKKGRVSNRRSAVSFGGAAYASVVRPATKGKFFFQTGRKIAEREAPKVFNNEMRGVIASRFR